MPGTLLLIVAVALALDPPVGWSAVTTDRAVLCPADPGRGELRELTVPGGTLHPQGLVSALSAEGVPARVLDSDPDGTITIDIGQDRVARARAIVGVGEVTWYLVQATRAASAQLDADALLAAIMPRPALLLGAQVEVLPAGSDGNLWDSIGTQAPAAPALGGPWGTAAPSVASWAPLQALVGIWAGSSAGVWGGQQMLLRLDLDGHLRIEEQGTEGTRITEGTWGAQADQLRFAPLTGAPVVSSYSVDSQSMTFVWGDRTVTLLRRR